MNKKKLDELMDKTQAYQDAYLHTYNQSNDSNKTDGSRKNFILLLI